MSFTIFAVPSHLRERIRVAAADLLDEGETLSVRLVRERCNGSNDHVSLLLRALRSGFLSLQQPWDGSTPPLNLERAIRDATSHEDRTRIHQEVAAQVAAGAMPPTVAKCIQDSLSAARLSHKAAQDRGSEGTAGEPILLLDRSSYLLAKVINRIVAPQILQEVIDFVIEAGERDLLAFPNETIEDAAQLREGASS